MSAGNFDACFAIEMKEEGGYVDNPKDPGRATNHGVTQATWQTFVGKNRVVTAADIRALTQLDVVPLYRVFWKGCAGEYLPAGVDLVTFDWCVNSGVRVGNDGMQRALGVPVDGLIGPVTLKAAAVRPAVAVDAICDAREAFYRSYETSENKAHREEWKSDGHGWLNRVASIRAAAKAMLARVPA